MKTVILDAKTLGDDMSFSSLEKVCSLTVYGATAPGEIQDRARGAEQRDEQVYRLLQLREGEDVREYKLISDSIFNIYNMVTVIAVLRQLGYPGDAIRRVAVSMYEGEINMVIHANGGEIDAEIDDHGITIVLRDQGPGIPDVEKAMQEGWSTASDEIRAQGFGAGMGLPNMKKYTDNMQIDTVLGVGTTISLRVDLH